MFSKSVGWFEIKEAFLQAVKSCRRKFKIKAMEYKGNAPIFGSKLTVTQARKPSRLELPVYISKSKTPLRVRAGKIWNRWPRDPMLDLDGRNTFRHSQGVSTCKVAARDPINYTTYTS